MWWLQAFATVSMLVAGTATAQQAYRLDLAVLREEIAASVREVASARRLLVDPRIVEQVVQSAGIYASNFCETPVENCSTRLVRGPILRSAVSTHIDRLTKLPNKKVQVFGDLLAEGKLALAGWPSQQFVEVGLLTIPPDLQDTVLNLRFATELSRLGVGVSLLALPGPLTIETASGKRWTVDVPVRQSVALVANRAGLARPLQPQPSALCDHVGLDIPYRGAFALFNQGRTTFAEEPALRAVNEAPYLKQFAVDIQVESEAGVSCDRDCQYSLSALFADALATWRFGCARCDHNALVLLRSNSIMWIDWRLARRLRLVAGGGNTSLDLANAEVDEGAVARVHPYADLSSDATVLLQLCALQSNAAPWVRSAQALACNASTGAGGASALVLKPTVALRSLKTACGSLAVACGLPNAGVEVNVGAYRYVLPGLVGTAEIILGKNNSVTPILDMRQVITHEVGHWFGVPHAQTGGPDQFLDVMAEAYGEGQACIAPHSLRMLSNAGDLRWTFRVKEGGALLPPRDTAKRTR